MFTNNFKALSEISAEAMECIVKYRQQASQHQIFTKTSLKLSQTFLECS